MINLLKFSARVPLFKGGECEKVGLCVARATRKSHKCACNGRENHPGAAWNGNREEKEEEEEDKNSNFPAGEPRSHVNG